MNEILKTYRNAFFLFLLFLLLSMPASGNIENRFNIQDKEIYKKFKVAHEFFLKGKEYFSKNKYKKAQKEFKKCIEKMPEYADALFYLSKIYYKEGKFSIALEYIEKAKCNFKYMNRFKLYLFKNQLLKLKKKKKNLEEKLFKFEQSSDTWCDGTPREKDAGEKNRLQSEIEKIEEETIELEKEINNISKTDIPPDYFFLAGNIYFKLKKFKESLIQYLETIKRNPQYGNAYNNIAFLYYIEEKYEKALEYLEMAEKKGIKINSEFKRAILKAINNKGNKPSR